MACACIWRLGAAPSRAGQRISNQSAAVGVRLVKRRLGALTPFVNFDADHPYDDAEPDSVTELIGIEDEAAHKGQPTTTPTPANRTCNHRDY